MGGLGIAVKRQTLHAVADALPVDKILAVQHRHAGQVGKAGRDQVVILPYAHSIGVAEIHRQDGVLVVAVDNGSGQLIHDRLLLFLQKSGPGLSRPALGHFSKDV